MVVGLGHSDDRGCGTNAFHQGATLSHADKLFPWGGVDKFQEIPVKIGEPHFTEQIWMQSPVRKSPLREIQCPNVVLKASQWTKDFHPWGIRAEGGAIPADESRTEPTGSSHVIGQGYE